MNEFLQYQSFASEDAAEPLLALLHTHGIPVETGLDRLDFDVNMAHNATDTRFVVRLRPQDFAVARQLEEQENEQLTASAAPDHYLFGFSDDELFEVLVKSEAWNGYNVALAHRILQQRGREISADTVRLLRRQQLNEIAKPEPAQKTWIVAGYLLAIFGGIMGLLIGWHWHYHRKPLPNGSRVLAYAPRDRAHGFRILLLAVLGLFGSLLLQAVRA